MSYGFEVCVRVEIFDVPVFCFLDEPQPGTRATSFNQPVKLVAPDVAILTALDEQDRRSGTWSLMVRRSWRKRFLPEKSEPPMSIMPARSHARGDAIFRIVRFCITA